MDSSGSRKTLKLEEKLHSAIQTGCLDIVKQLVKDGANMDHVLGKCIFHDRLGQSDPVTLR